MKYDKKYQVCIFPSLFGTPWFASTRRGAMFLAHFRRVLALLRWDPRTIEVYEHHKDGDKLIATL